MSGQPISISAQPESKPKYKLPSNPFQDNISQSFTISPFYFILSALMSSNATSTDLEINSFSAFRQIFLSMNKSFGC
nr:hypothetical protein Itr_chr03CG16070 [Ipomoea trifida]GMD57544.1 hypothetical protein Iba_chr11eCG13770 [Ipomoea batatas]